MYKYHFRPVFGSDQSLIEIFDIVANDIFFADFLNAISAIKPVVSTISHLSMQEEMGWNLTSEIGEFLLSTDSWNIAFITAESNQPCLTAINALLDKSEKFEKAAIGRDNCSPTDTN